MLIISKDSFNLKVKSALACNPNTSGLSIAGTLSTYSLYLLISAVGFAGILYLNLSLFPDEFSLTTSVNTYSFPNIPSLI